MIPRCKSPTVGNVVCPSVGERGRPHCPTGNVTGGDPFNGVMATQMGYVHRHPVPRLLYGTHGRYVGRCGESTAGCPADGAQFYFLPHDPNVLRKLKDLMVIISVPNGTADGQPGMISGLSHIPGAGMPTILPSAAVPMIFR